MQRPLQRRYSPLSLVVCLSLTSLLLTACGGAPPAKTYTIGVVNYYSMLESMLGGFKAQMAALGYVEGENITYIYHGILGSDPAVLGGEIKSLAAQKVNLLLAMGTPAALAAQKAMVGMHIPVVFTLVINPVKEGIVESLTRPGGNITGVQVINASPKAMEWLLKLVPSTKTVYVPYHPEDRVAVMTIKPLPEAAARLGVELVLNEVHSPEEVMAAIETLPKNAAILFIPTPGLTSRMSAISQFAIERGIPAGGYTLPAEDVLFTYGPNGTDQGKQVARLVDQILKGAKPADLPVQTAELFLRINLKTATAIGLDIPDEIIRQADTVMR